MRTEFDYTMMSTFLNCKRKYDFRINKGLVPKTTALPLSFGGAIHSALDIWFTSGDMIKGIEEFNKQYIENKEIDDKRTNEMGTWILNNYATTYASEPFKVLASEISFDLELPNGNRFIGRIDKIVEWNGEIWVMDHKTTSSLGPSIFKTAEPSMQFYGYVWAARKLGYTKCVGILVDYILVAKGLLQASTRAKLTPLARFDVYANDEILSEWLDTICKIQHDIKYCEESDSFYPTFDSCTYYGECPYRRICLEIKEHRDRIIAADFEIKQWDPRGDKGKEKDGTN